MLPIDTKRLQELREQIVNRNNSIVSANANKMDSHYLAMKTETTKTDQDVASTNPSTCNLPEIKQDITSQGTRSKKSKQARINIDMIDSDEDFNSENFSNMQSSRSKKSKEVYTVIRRESITPSEKMLIKEKQQKEKEEQERQAKLEADRIKGIMDRHHETYMKGISIEAKANFTRKLSTNSINSAKDTMHHLE